MKRDYNLTVRKNRLCQQGFPCGDTCISRSKICLKKLGSIRAKETALRLKREMLTYGKKLRGQEKSPDLLADI